MNLIKNSNQLFILILFSEYYNFRTIANWIKAKIILHKKDKSKLRNKSQFHWYY